MSVGKGGGRGTSAGSGFFSALLRVFSLYRKELLSFFVSPIAYIVLFVFLLGNGLFFHFYLRVSGGNLEVLLRQQYASITFWFFALLVPPLMTMRTFAEEHRTGTYEHLVTAGVGEVVLVCGKFLACWTFFLLLWGLMLLPYALIEMEADLDWGMIASVNGGIILLGGLFTAVGVFSSSFTKNQLVAASVALIINMLVFFVYFLRLLFDAGEFELRYFQYVSPLAHFSEDFTRGLFDFRTVILYASVSWLFLFMAVKTLERRRWW